ncbi:MAG: hypothetical protein AB7H70_08745 [Rhodospirillaceae bacterium]
MTRILVFLLAILALPGCAALPTGVDHTAYARDYWHGYVDWTRGFAVDAPGRFTIAPARPITAGVIAPQSYTLDRGTLRFSVVAVQRRKNDERSASEIAKQNGFDLYAWDRIGGKLPAYQRHVYLDGKMYRQRLVFGPRMVYELLVSGPADVFPDFAARRFFDSFVVMVKT